MKDKVRGREIEGKNNKSNGNINKTGRNDKGHRQ